MDIGGTTYVVPPLSLGALEKFQEKLANFKGDISPESISITIDVTLAALQRNYPALTRDELKEQIDIAQMGDVMLAVMDVSGIRRKEAEAKKAMPSNQ